MGSQDVLDRVRSERENPHGDIWWGAPSTMFMNAAKEGLLQKYKPTWADVVDKQYRDAGMRRDYPSNIDTLGSVKWPFIE